MRQFIKTVSFRNPLLIFGLYEKKTHFYIRYELCGVTKIENSLIWTKPAYLTTETNGNRNIYIYFLTNSSWKLEFFLTNA